MVLTHTHCRTFHTPSTTHWNLNVTPITSPHRPSPRWTDAMGSRNVGAEGAGFLLGVQTLPDDTADCVFLADFLNALAWDCGAAK